ncbi:hypothetical protein SAMN05216270_11131 [Glycomyces harbinensis]|uniref:Uncharacterized protein n=1 Tax=Glycomyces harbinensis TaxID=58114 RepID=A0A1G6ZIE5_9ACTN|nr:hypothetical protein SAMN05216270_11131 [Glycomyces harbinensis]
MVVVGVVCALASGCGLVAAFGDLYGENPVSWSMVLGPMVVTVFPTVELAWSRDRDLSMASMKRRWLVLPFLGVLGAVVAMGLAELAVYAVNAEAAGQAADVWLDGFSADGPALVSVSYGLLGYFIGLLLAVAFYSLILWPLQLIRRQGRAIGEHPMDTADPDTTLD